MGSSAAVGQDSRRWTSSLGASDDDSDGFVERIASWSSSFVNQGVLKLSSISWIASSSSEDDQNRKGATWLAVWPRFKWSAPSNNNDTGGLVGILHSPVRWGSLILFTETISWNTFLQSTSQNDERFLLLLVFLLLFILVFLWRILLGRKRKTDPRNARRDPLLHIDTTGSPVGAHRSRSTSFDLTSPMYLSSASGFTSPPPQQRERFGTETSLEQDQARRPAFPVIMGPLVNKLVYKTHTPPLSWAEASKKLLPKDTKTRSQKQLVLKISEQTLTTQGVSSSDHRVETHSIDDISLHVKSPVEGAVLEIYVKDEPHHEWVEHTFHTALDAAQFQFDLLGCQVLGSPIQYMYDALEVVHKGSEAHDGIECLLHDCEHDEKVRKGAVAWDDAMRCFSGITTLRLALEHQLMSLQHSLGEDNEIFGEGLAIRDDYVDKRHLLGPVDFFRLFVPLLPPTSFPQEDSNPQRMEQILRSRKIVGQASLLVKHYVAARVVVNHGWKLTPQELPEGYMSKRLAYDSGADNSAHDIDSINEYYEGTVSRDVICSVHSKRHVKERGASRQSAYQAYCLVGTHVFRLPPEVRDHPLKSTEDPVEALPSLRRIIDAHPGLDFFVFAFFPQGIRVAFIHLFVRWLPRGIDTKFDTVLDRFINGSVETRKRKLEVFMQLGPGSKLSTLAWAAIKAASTVLGWTQKAEAEVLAGSGRERTSFPGMNFDRYTDTRHFGGSLRRDLSLPDNYVSVTSQINLSRMNVGVRSLYQRLEEGALPASVVDFTFVLEGQKEDELPERAMASVRFVHIDPVKIALPTYYSAVTRIEASSQVVSFLPDMAPASGSMPAEVRSMPGASAASTGVSSRRLRTLVGGSRSVVTENGFSYDPSSREDADSFRDGIDALIEILQGVSVPALSDQGAGDRENILVLDSLTRSDLRRYFVAADCHLKDAASRVVKSVAWRVQTFPIDVNECRVELQTGQFFQYGYDLQGHPVYYFQNMCLGPWRQDEHALISAVLHRLESSLQMENRKVKVTVIINVGKPIHKKSKKNRGDDETTSTNAEQSQATTTLAPEYGDTETRAEASVSTAATTSTSDAPSRRKGTNPRILACERYHAHSNSDVISRLVGILLDHYPERLHKALILPGDMFTVLGGSLAVRSFVSSTKTRSKVFVLSRASELKQHVSKSELSVIVGGSAAVPRSAFECK